MAVSHFFVIGFLDKLPAFPIVCEFNSNIFEIQKAQRETPLRFLFSNKCKTKL